MRQSQLFTKTTKTVPKDEISLNIRLLTKAGFVDKLTAGVYSLLPLGLRVVKKIEQIIREEINAIEGQEILMPALCPAENYKKTGRFDVLVGDILFEAESKHAKNLVLNQSHEEVLSPLMKKFISSYKDLPVAVYQFQDKFRGEARPKSGVLRTREFIMKDLYSFHTDQKDLDKYYDQVIEAYRKIFKRCGVEELTFLTYASGGTFSKYSHEFQTLTEAGEDLIHICDSCKIAVNQEIIDEQGGKCPECGSGDLRKEKTVEVGNIFKLGTKFAEPFDLNFADEKGEKKLVIMGCYGIGLQRLMGTIAELRNDEAGMIWPESVAPFQVHLISLDKNKEAGELYEKLVGEGVEVLFDDREDVGAGEKFVEADLIGCPIRVVVSEKTLKEKGVEIKKRSEEKTEIVSKEELMERLR